MTDSHVAGGVLIVTGLLAIAIVLFAPGMLDVLPTTSNFKMSRGTFGDGPARVMYGCGAVAFVLLGIALITGTIALGSP